MRFDDGCRLGSELRFGVCFRLVALGELRRGVDLLAGPGTRRLIVRQRRVDGLRSGLGPRGQHERVGGVIGGLSVRHQWRPDTLGTAVLHHHRRGAGSTGLGTEGGLHHGAGGESRPAGAQRRRRLQCGLHKEAKAHHIVGVAVEVLAREEVVGGVRLDEKALAPVHPPEEDRAMNGPSIPRYPQVLVADLQIPDVAVGHAGVLREHHLDALTPALQLVAEPKHDVSQPARLGCRGTFGSDHHHIHRARPDRGAGRPMPARRV